MSAKALFVIISCVVQSGDTPDPSAEGKIKRDSAVNDFFLRFKGAVRPINSEAEFQNLAFFRNTGHTVTEIEAAGYPEAIALAGSRQYHDGISPAVLLSRNIGQPELVARFDNGKWQ